jgi:uncharacterized protein YbjT (DUF2867 family)
MDVVVSSANGYMKESIDVDFEGNKNLIEAAARAGAKRFVFLSIVACDAAPEVPHFHAKKVAEDLIKAKGLPFVIVRAPAFLDVPFLSDGPVRVGNTRQEQFFGPAPTALEAITRWADQNQLFSQAQRPAARL